MSASLAIFSGLGPLEFAALVILGIMLYGKNLPTVARTLGRTIGEFRKQMKSVEEQVRREAFQEELRQARDEEDRKDREEMERQEKRRALQPPAAPVKPMEAAGSPPPAATPPPAEASPAPAAVEPPAAGPAGPPSPLP